MTDTPNPDIEAETARMSPEALDGDRIKAPVAAALERAAQECDKCDAAWDDFSVAGDEYAERIRALIDTDHAAALDAALEQARREERAACKEITDGIQFGNYVSWPAFHGDDGCVDMASNLAELARALSAAIRARGESE